MKDVGKVGSVALCALLPAALIAGVPLVAGAASATTPTSSTTPPSIRLGGLTAVPAQRIDLAGGVRAHRKKSLKVIGRAGIPSAGVSSLKARVTVRSSRAGKITIYPSATSGGRVTIAVRAGKSVSKTVTIKIGTKGRWTFQNKTGGKLRAHLSTRGFVSSSIANSATPCGRQAGAPAWEHVVWVVLENHGPASVAANAPYLSSLGSKCASATNYWARTHPSLPNYIALTSGSRQGIADSGVPSEHPLNVDNIFSQLGTNWRTLAQSMPSNCYKQNSGAYVARHNPATYYTNLGGACASQDVPLPSKPDLSAKFTLIVPDNSHNGHDVSMAVADNWLAGYLPKVLDSREYRAGKTAVFVLFDEDDGAGDVENNVNLFVLSPSTPVAGRDGTRLTHYSALRATEEMLGLGLLGGAATAPDLRAGFNLN